MPESTLNVQMSTLNVGVICTDTNNRMSFRYSTSWLESPSCFPVSISLPLTQDIFPPEEAHSFFANLLPEGSPREHLTKRLGISVENDFELLSRIGGECAGALWIGVGVPPIFGEQRYQNISEKVLSDLIMKPCVYSSFAESGKARLSLAGAQDKLPVLFRDEKVLLPLHWAPSSHILKFPNRDYGDLPANEVLMTSLAGHTGLNVAEAKIYRIGDNNACLVSRYDRIMTPQGVLLRLHQEDFCQAMGLPSSRKYEQEGGPTFQQCYQLIKDVSAEPIVDCEQLLRWLVFNLLIGNTDAHAKNLSLLYNFDGRIRLAPFYDLVSTLSFHNLSRNMSMRIGSRSDPGQIGPRQFDILADECGLRSVWLRAFVLDMAEIVSEAINDGLDRLIVDPVMYQRVIPTVRKQTEHVRNIFRQAAGTRGRI